MSDLLPEVRRLIAAGKLKEAEALMPAAHADRSGADRSGSTSAGRDPYQPFAEISIRPAVNGPFRCYRRGIDLDTALAWTAWQDDQGEARRELFVSRADDTVYLRLTRTAAGALHCRIAIRPTAREKQADEWHPGQAGPPETASTAGGNTIVYRADYGESFAFGAVLQVDQVNGTVTADGDCLEVDGADEVVIRARLYIREDPATAVPRLQTELAGGADFDAAFQEHTVVHNALFRRMQLDLKSTDDASIDELLMQAYDGDMPAALAQRMFNFGRHLLICSSREGGWPANLQGIWNGDYAPAWNSDFHTDENIQMNYWAALPGNLAETALPFFDYFEKMLGDFRDNAGKIFGCRGIFVPIAITTNGVEGPRIWTNWISAAGWLAQHFYDYYLFTGDQEFLRQRAVPWLKEVATFYEDFLIEDDNGKLLFSPSLSPENKPAGSDSLLCQNATMDVAICKEVLSNLCDACELLGIEMDNVATWRGMLAKLPAYEINADGAMREWLHPAYEDNYHHRHQSHIYPVFPGFEVTAEDNPEIFEACRVAVEKRLVVGLTSQTGWSMAHMANIYARLGQGDRALECIEILARSSTGPNLLTYHNDWRHMGLSLTWGNNPPFQIDANFGITAAILEMLVFSKPGLVKLLPALPERWPQGRATGIACRGQLTVDLEWDVPKQQFSATLVSAVNQKLTLRLPDWVRDPTVDGAAAGPGGTPAAGCRDLEMAAGAALTIHS